MTERRLRIAANRAAKIYENQAFEDKNMPGAISDALGEDRFNKDDRREAGRLLGWHSRSKAKKDREEAKAVYERYRAIADHDDDALMLNAHCDHCDWVSDCPYTDDPNSLRQAMEMLQRCHDEANPDCRRKITHEDALLDQCEALYLRHANHELNIH